MPRHGDNIRQRQKLRTDGTVYVYFSTEVSLETADGSRRRVHFEHAVRAEVEKWRHRQLADREHGLRRAERDRSTVGGWCEHWLQTIVTRQYRPPTVESYGGDIHRHIQPALGRIPLQKLTSADVDAWVSDLLERKRLAPSTTRRCLVILRKALGYAVRQGFLSRNVASKDHVEKIVVKAPPVRALSLEQVRTLLAAVQGTPDAVLYALELPRGLRAGELLGLRWSDVDLARRELHIRQQAQKGKLTDLKNEASQRILALTATEVDLLHEQRARCIRLQVKAGSRWQAEWDMVFPTATGRPKRNANQHKAWKRLLGRAGLPDFKFHDLRHSAATLALAHGVPLFDVSRMLGHASLATTADRYGAWTDQGRQQTAERMATILGG
jgi:integrase